MRKYLQFFLLSFLAMSSSVYAQDMTLAASKVNDNTFIAEDEMAPEYRILTSSEADKVISVLRNYKEIVLYCGHERERETYMVLCDYWKEQVTEEDLHYFSDVGIVIGVDPLKDWYEIWVLGYDLHTGDTICTPIDPSCIWFHEDNRTYNMGNYTLLNSEIKPFPFFWKVPKYTLINCLNKYTNGIRPTYHHDIHVLGFFTPYDHMPSPPSYYMTVKKNPNQQIGHRDTPSGRPGINPPTTSSGDSDSSIINNSSSNQHIDSQARPKDNIHRGADTIQFQQVEQKTHQIVEPQEKQINFQQTEKEGERIEQPQPWKEEKQLTEMQRLQAEIQRQQDIIQQQRTEIQRLQAEVKQQQSKISSQQAEISSQRSEIQRQQSKISSQQSEIQQQKNEIQQLKMKIASQQSEIQRKQGDVKQHR